ncbi:PepSY domain-containing protein [Vibrio sp. SCSIO 43136]|uniref:PepSY domain-containing protein n=1 Tax=Vibrio sp. SCSIO 43136 TaxID=2819101 RepID=UPI002074AD3A|nr:PepSY domain-containing protein [Vibrio sp. SCSIO 43136]USD64171.1 hypothetical protein J4N39_08580 [Vibrio sp. SCSIO 43136]
MFHKLFSATMLTLVPWFSFADTNPSDVPILVDVQQPEMRIDIDEDQDEVFEAVKQGKVQPFSALYAAVESQLNGRVIKVELEEDDDEWIYELKLMHDNNIIKAEYDASTLELIELRGRQLNEVIKK